MKRVLRILNLTSFVALVSFGNLSDLCAEPYPGYTFYGNNNGRTTYLLNLNNQVVKSWNHNRSGGYSAYLLENGHVLRTANSNRPILNGGGAQGVVEEYNWNGNLLWEYTYSSATVQAHHDIEYMPNGNVLMIAWELKTAAQTAAAGYNRNAALWPDHIIEVRKTGQNSGEIVWEWHAWDHLIQDYNQNRANYGVVANHPELLDINMTGGGGGIGGGDWMHINGISYNPELDQIVISSHTLNEIYVIDHSTTTQEAASHEGGNSGRGGDILYRWGNPSQYDAQGAQIFRVCHCAWWIPQGLPGAGDIMVFNNREGLGTSMIVQITPPYDDDGNYFRAQGQAFGPANMTWSYTANNFYANHLGGCQRLPNGNTLIAESTRGRLFEVNANGDIQWQITGRGEVPRALRYGLNYPGLYDLNPLADGTLTVNELLADNIRVVADQDGEYDGWIEIYNNSNTSVSLSGFYLSDDVNEPAKWGFPDTSIGSHDFLIVWADGQINQAGLHANFQLNRAGGRVVITAPNRSILENIQYGQQTSDISYGRYPDGSGNFIPMTPTFGESNLDGILILDYYFVINEVLAYNRTVAYDEANENDPWIEVYNYGEGELSLNGLYLSDDPNNPTKWAFPNLAIQSGAFFIIWIDNDPGQGEFHTNFELSRAGGVILLSNARRTVIDRIDYEVTSPDISYGRYPDGTGDLILMSPTFGRPNIDHIIDSAPDDRLSPDQFGLTGIYPNPFNAKTTLTFSLGRSSNIRLSIFDVSGNEVANLVSGIVPAGRSVVVWDAMHPVAVNSGVFVCSFSVNGITTTHKIVLIK